MPDRLKTIYVPDACFASICDVSAEFLKKKGIRYLLVDLDNTLVPYSPQELNDELVLWERHLRDAGITVMIVSNNRTYRVGRFAKMLGVEYVRSAKKPHGQGISEAMRLMGAKPGETALAGDQVRTDIKGAKHHGLYAIFITPVKLGNPFLKIRHKMERHVLKFCKERYDE